MTISPNNPSGAVYSKSALTAINQLCEKHGAYHISDEAYEYFTYGETPHFSPAALPASAPHTIALYSLSKAFGFASWRIGYMVVPTQLTAGIKKIQDTNLICPPVVSQHAALAALALGKRYCEPHLAALAEVRSLVLDKLSVLGNRISIPNAEGAFYILMYLDTNMTPMSLVERLIAEHRVAVIPGTTFGIEDRSSIRVAYGALDRETVAEGVGRLTKGLQALLD